jgi:hypothetical protein
MPVWQVVLMLNVALVVGTGLGYGAWGGRLGPLERERAGLAAQVERLDRERQACAAGARAGQQQWEGRGVVRAAYPELLLVTHEEIRGLLPARTTGFRAALGADRPPLQVGAAILFRLQGRDADDAVLVDAEPW